MTRYRVLIGGQKNMRSGRHVLFDGIIRLGGFLLIVCLVPLMIAVALPIFLLFSCVGLIIMMVLLRGLYKIKKDLRVQAQSINHSFGEYDPAEYSDSKKTTRGYTVEGKVERRVIRPASDT